jgi:hypothetical protein
MGERMSYDKLWDAVVRADWYAMAFALAISSFVVAAVLTWNTIRIWKHIATIETQLNEMRKEITTILQVQTALITTRGAKSKVEIDPHGTEGKTGAGDVAALTMSPPTTFAQPESARSEKSPE